MQTNIEKQLNKKKKFDDEYYDPERNKSKSKDKKKDFSTQRKAKRNEE
jgi:hypothetical protein